MGMNRDILFRAKRVDNGKWVYGYYAVIGKRNVIIKAENEEFYSIDEDLKKKSGNEVIEVQKDTVCEYTGLTGRNGRKIFENDIVGIYSEYRNEWDYGVVGYGEFNCSCCSGVYGWHFGDEDIRNYEMYEVRGNIFDNPKLIKLS